MPDNYLKRAQEKYGPIDQELLDEFEAALANLPADISPLHVDDPELDGESEITKTVILSRALRYVARQLHIDFDHPDLIGKLQPRDTTSSDGSEGNTEIVQSTLNMYQSFFYSMLALTHRAAQTAIVAMLEQQRALSATFFPDPPRAAPQPARQLARTTASPENSSSPSIQQSPPVQTESANAISGSRAVSSDRQIRHPA